ncbi:MAG: chorismate-binding protein [Flavobacteriales bacterium]|nr:chorismate-binding protein [Flavobacteriales bacterium]MBP9080437.1 chorismate-binding protein [Flavobacteriales bacterium]
MSTPSVLQQALAQCIARSLTFAAFRRPGRPVQLWAQRTPELETVEGTLLLGLNQVFLVAPFDLDPARVPFIRADVELRFAEIDPDISPLHACQGTAAGATAMAQATPKSDFLAAVASAQRACQARELNKVVLSRVIDAPLDPARLPELFTRAITANDQAFVALAHTPEHGLWLGASPERLVHEEHDHVRVDALAATRPAEAIPERISGWGAKELDEQEQVLTHVHSTFARMDLQRITVRGPEVLKAGPVAHLHTVLEADLGDTLLGDLVLALHPTPAVCGTPTAAARTFIAHHETHQRSLYTGFWGPWNADGPTELFVNLRCLQAVHGTAKLFVGAGITAGSDAEQEWIETERKAETWLQLLREPMAAQ